MRTKGKEEHWSLKLEALSKKLTEYRDALRWCSAVSDFQLGGKARKGWNKIKHLCE